MRTIIVMIMISCAGGLRVFAQDSEAVKRKFEILVDGQIFHSVEEYKESSRKAAAERAAVKSEEEKSPEHSYREFLRRVPDPERFSFDPAKIRTIDLAPARQGDGPPDTQQEKAKTVAPSISMYHLIAAVVMARTLSQDTGEAVDAGSEFHAVRRLFRNVDVSQGVFSAVSGFDDEAPDAGAVLHIRPDELEASVVNTIHDVEVPLLIISGKDKVRVMALEADEAIRIDEEEGVEE